MTYRYYITNLTAGRVEGTDSDLDAANYAKSEDFFVVDSHNDSWLTTEGTADIELAASTREYVWIAYSSRKGRNEVEFIAPTQAGLAHLIGLTIEGPVPADMYPLGHIFYDEPFKPTTELPAEEGMYFLVTEDGEPLCYPYHRFVDGKWRCPSAGPNDSAIYAVTPWLPDPRAFWRKA